MFTYIVESDTHWRASTDPVGSSDETEIAFNIDTGINADNAAANVASAIERNLPLAPTGLNWNQPLHIYANGPSARTAPKHFPAMALNNAYSLFPGGPDIWAALDSHPMVAGFVANPSAKTRHLVASKCDPSAFDALTGFDTYIWHVGDNGAESLPDGSNVILPGTSVTTTVLGLCKSMGLKEVHVYGWDCCYGENGEAYSVEQPHRNPMDINVTIGNRTFFTAAKWAAEVKVAIEYMQHLSGMSITVHGQGMMAAAMAFAFQERQEAA